MIPESTQLILGAVTVLGPLAAFALISLAFLRSPTGAKLVALGGIAASLVATSLLLFGIHDPSYRLQWTTEWLLPLDRTFQIGLLLDPLALVMAWVVSLVGFLVQWYSVSYMEHDERQGKFFAFISLFCFAMLGFTLSPNLFQSYACWELVGLGSYLLIGFWGHLPSAATAARKAFVMTRLGDLGFFAGILVVMTALGTADFGTISQDAARSAWLAPLAGLDVATWVSLGLFLAVAGKSAQFPLYGWLPDAMEGPTPVSALIHAATMVAAGVYLLARTSFLYTMGSDLVHMAWHGFAAVAMLTALMSGLVAIVQSDIKRVLAYSTISQLGFMIVAICTGAVLSGMMHLFTHAFFKALLFLAAGAFIHAAHSNSITDIARAGGRTLTLAMASLIAGTLALSGVFPFAGFYSKDAILEHLLAEGHFVLFAGGLAAALITAFYMARVVFLMLAVKPEGHSHLHIGRWMVLPLGTLIVGALASGNLWSLQVGQWFGEVAHPEDTVLWATILSSTAAALLGIYYSARVYYWRTSRDPLAHLPRLAVTLSQKWYLDHAYEFTVRRIYLPFTALLRQFELTRIKGALDGIGSSSMNIARGFSRLQSGELQQYLGLMFVATAAVLFLLTSW
jgi:NADH-quinone oxidoreductase subunit L